MEHVRQKERGWRKRLLWTFVWLDDNSQGTCYVETLGNVAVLLKFHYETGSDTMSFKGGISTFLLPNPLFYGLYYSLSFHCFTLAMGQASEILTGFPTLFSPFHIFILSSSLIFIQFKSIILKV